MTMAQKQAKNNSNRSVTDNRQSSGKTQLAHIADTRPEAIAQQELMGGFHNSPRMVVQRQHIDGYISLGNPIKSVNLALNRTQIPIQAKLSIGQPNDKYEQEADRIANRVVSEINSPTFGITPEIQPEQSQTLYDNKLQTKPIMLLNETNQGGEASTQLESTINRAKCGGQPLGKELQQSMGQAMGVDFSGVLVHTDAQADRLNQSIQAKAFTTGKDVFFRQGAYQPESRSGQKLIAHELTHVAQQQNRSQSRVLQLAGDKIAFEKVPSLDTEIQNIQILIEKTITQHQSNKRDYKNKIEFDKDKDIASVPPVDRVTLKQGLSKKELDDELEPERKPKRKILKRFVSDYKESGWYLKELKEEILYNTNRNVFFEYQVNDEIPIMMSKGQKRIKIYSIFFGTNRFTASVPTRSDIPINPVFVKKGTNKEYVKDARGTFITRYASRGCDLSDLIKLLSEGILKPRNPTDVIGENQLSRYDFNGKEFNDKMSPREREFVQLRDGSGPDQRFLSITHAKAIRKVFGNHGDLFTSQSAVKIDLAKIPPSVIFNQHLEVSHAGLVSLANIERKSTAEEERKTAVYSVIKNRETLLSVLPRDAITEVAVGNGPWMSLHDARLIYDLKYKEAEKEKIRIENENAAKKEESAKKRQESKAQEQDKDKAIKEEAKNLHKKLTEFLGKMKPKDKKKLLSAENENWIIDDKDGGFSIFNALKDNAIGATDVVDDNMLVKLNTYLNKT